MISYLFLGDSHGDCDFFERACWLASEEGCKELISVGDFGFVWPGTNLIDYLDTLLDRYGLTLRWVEGNHDHHDWLDTINPVPWRGHVKCSERIFYQPRGSTYTDEDGTRFLFCGGAPSIDKEYRTPGKSWWSQETITEEQYRFALKAPGPFDVLVTHDAAEYPPGFGPKGIPEFQALGKRSMEMIQGLIDYHRPALHVHGHWHVNYARGEYSPTMTVGLASNLQTLEKASMVWSKS